MKKYLFRMLPACMALTFLAFASCSGNESNAPKAGDKKKTVKTESSAGLPNYRYVDLDTVLSRYNLAKDYNEEMLRMQNNMESAPSVMNPTSRDSQTRCRRRCRTTDTSRKQATSRIKTR